MGENMKKLLAVFILLNVLLISACSNTVSSSENKKNERSVEKISFDVTYQALLQELTSNNFRFSEKEVKSFDHDEKLISGVIYMSDNEFEICRAQVRTFNNRIAQVHLNYDISGDEFGYDNFPVIMKVVVYSIKPDIPNNYIEDLEKHSDDFYSKDYNDLRISLTYSEKYLGTGTIGTAIDCSIVHLDFMD